MITLSQKTLDAKITITRDGVKYELSRNNLYYKIDTNFKGKLTLETNENDAFVHFLYGFEENDEYEILFQTSYNNYQIIKKASMLILPYTQKEIEIQLSSSKPFKFSFSNGYSNDNNYYYISPSNNKIDSLKNNDKYISSLTYHNLYRNVVLGDGGFFSFVINVNLNEKSWFETILKYRCFIG